MAQDVPAKTGLANLEASDCGGPLHGGHLSAGAALGKTKGRDCRWGEGAREKCGTSGERLRASPPGGQGIRGGCWDTTRRS